MVPKLLQVLFPFTHLDLLWDPGLRLCTGLLRTDGVAQLCLDILWSPPKLPALQGGPMLQPMVPGAQWGSLGCLGR